MIERTYTTTEIAKEYQLSAVQLNKLLQNENVIVKVEDSYRLRTAHQQKGLVRIYTTNFVRSDGTPDERSTMKWTETGKFFVENLLERLGFVKGVNQNG